MADDESEIDEEVETDQFTCWCGATGHFEDMFDYSDAEGGCGGSGTINCYCGGDFCVCHHHGEYECDGCVDCRSGEDGCECDYDNDDY